MQPARRASPMPSPTLLKKSVLAALLFSCLALVAAQTFGGAGPEGETARVPASEKLTFRLQWGVIPVGQAILESRPADSTGKDLRHLAVTARSNTFVDLFFKVRDRIESLADLTGPRSLWYSKNIQEGERERIFEVQFNEDQNLAERLEGGLTSPPVSTPMGTLDPLSFFYHLRGRELRENAAFQAWVTDGKRLTLGKVTVLGKEKVRAPLGGFETFRVEVVLKNVDGVFRTGKKGKFTVWAAPKHGNMPVKIQCALAVGPFTGIMTAILESRL